MTNNTYNELTGKVEEYVKELFAQRHSDKHTYHNLDHTQTVVEHCQEIAKQYELGPNEMFVLEVSAWFHDTGHLLAPPELHEAKSTEIMEDFFSRHPIAPELLEEIKECILATRDPRNPLTIVQKILCDADMYHVGTNGFKKYNKRAFQEQARISQHKPSKAAFINETIEMMELHQFYTSYCQENLNAGKAKNMKKLKKKHEKNIEEAPIIPALQEVPVINEKHGTTKGMQTMLRLTSANHIKLSDMADSKANILISVNAIIISVILSILLRKLQTDPYLTLPTIFFLASSVATIVVAILATRPKLSSGLFMEEDVTNKKTNLLFFGNFHKMPQANYENAMRTMMKDPDYLYSSIIQDIYSLGAVLGKKYRLVRIAYNIFMFGIIISVIAFALASVINLNEPAQALPNSTGSPF